MPHKKTITMVCYGPIGVSPQHYSGWEDVWIRYYQGKGKPVEEGPCIIGGRSLQFDIEFAEKMHQDGYERQETIDELKDIQKQFDDGEPFAVDDINNRLANIYVNKEVIKRKDAEQAIEWWLRKRGIVKSEVRFRWKKNKIMVIVPWG